MKNLNKLFLHESSPRAGRYCTIEIIFSRMKELGRFHDFSKGQVISFHFYTQAKVLPFCAVLYFYEVNFTKLKLEYLLD